MHPAYGLRAPLASRPHAKCRRAKFPPACSSGKLIDRANCVLGIMLKGRQMGMIRAIWLHLFKDKRPEWEIRRESEFVKAANQLKTLRVTERGGMSIDPEEIRDQIIAAREEYKHLVRRS